MRFYEDPQKTSENRERPRAYYIPEGASEYISLNGEWKFAFFENGDAVTEMPQRWDKITVPSVWQLQGYEFPNYSNITFPFPCDMPYVPNVNPMGVYQRDFEINDTGMAIYAVFEGLCSCGVLYINDKYVGFTQGSHLQSEFNITPYVKKGRNTITVKVYKWSVGSYLEDQDMYRFNGIFRDVYILVRPSDHIKDITIRSEDDNKIVVRTDRLADIRLYDGELLIGEAKARYHEFVLAEPKRWNAETPNLYTVELEYKGEVIRQRVGIREINVSSKNEILVNGMPVILKGVNHHDTHPENGWCLTDEEIYEDIKKIKALNANTIRTSHYPPSPKFLEYCDEIGMYVILEADNEAHGFIHRYPDREYCYDMAENEWPATHPDWLKEHLNRAERTYARDKNHASVIMWSVGNECGYGPNVEAMAEFFRLNDFTRLVHSESASLLEIDSKNLSVYSRMYPSVPELTEWLDTGKYSKPIFLCEYCLAQGNGPGDIWEYVDLFLKYPQMAGGCIWQWADHTVMRDGHPTYGGDFEGEIVHDRDFCCNGVVFHDRKLKTSALELRAAYLPFRFKYENGEITITNYYDFTSLAEYKIRYRMRVDDVIIENNTVQLSISPKQSQVIKPKKTPKLCSYGASIDVTLIDPQGNEVGTLSQKIDIDRSRRELGNAPVKEKDITDSQFHITVNGRGFEYRFNKQLGNFDSIKIKGKELLNAPVKIGAYRALTNNDLVVKDRYTTAIVGKGENLNYTFNNVRSVVLEGNTITTEGVLAGIGRLPFFKYTLKYTFHKDGTVGTELTGDIRKDAPWLLRLGFEYEFVKDMKSFEYFGMGPYENLPDMCHHVSENLYKSTAKDEYVPYIIPQDHGNHLDVKYAEIDKKIRFESNDTFVLNVSQYSINQLDKASHEYELTQPYATHVRVDYKISGTGSSSCGPWVRDCFRITEKNIKFAFSFMPAK